MPDGRDFYQGDRPGGRDCVEVERPARTEHEASQRARYLAKAASLGHVVLDDEPPAADH